MKKIVEEIRGEGLKKLLGETVTFFCCRYIYSGKVIGVDENFVLLSDAGIVYETGELNSSDWKDRQALPHDWYLARESIESFGVLK